MRPERSLAGRRGRLVRGLAMPLRHQSPMTIAAPVVRGLAVAVGAEETDVLEPVFETAAQGAGNRMDKRNRMISGS